MDLLRKLTQQMGEDYVDPVLALQYEGFESDFVPMTKKNNCVEEHVFADVEMFETYVANGKDTVAQVFKKEARLRGGRHMIEGILKNPTSDFASLKEKQECLRKLGQDAALMSTVRDALTRMSVLEPDVMWAFRNPGEEAQALYDMVYFNAWYMRGLNASPLALTACSLQRIVVSPMIGVLTPAVYILGPYLVLLYHGIRMSFMNYVRMLYTSFTVAGSMLSATRGGAWVRYLSIGFTLIFYFQSLFSSIEVSTTLSTVCRIISDKMKNVHEFLATCVTLRKRIVDAGLSLTKSWLQVKDGPLDTCTFEGEALASYSIFSNFGKSLKAFKEFNSEDNGHLVRWAYLLDAVVAIEETRLSNGFCFVDFVEGSQKAYEADGLFHPCLVGKVVTNSVNLSKKNMILTGPNAGGKSTLLKSILISALLSQSTGIAPCARLRHTPFHLVRSQINVPDCKGSQSLFEAEMFRCKDSLEKLRVLGHNKSPSLVVMDEIFSSTNVVEGISGAFAVAKALASLESNITVISTHFAYLCKLAKTTHFTNYKMQVDMRNDEIRYPYLMVPGISKQFVALELLKKNGFDASIIDDALEVRTRLTSPRV